MRVHLISDLHLEYHPYTYKYPEGGADLIVLAGDISSGLGNCPLTVCHRRFVTLLRQCGQYAPVVYVPGNHDFYGFDMTTRLAELRALCQEMPRVHLLDCEARTIAGLRVFGATLWTDFSLGGYQFGVHEAMRMNDFRCISYDGHAIRIDDMKSLHYKALEAYDGITKPVDLVVTHFMPSPSAISQKYSGSPLNAYFCTDQDHRMRGDGAPAVWMFGHTHGCVDRVVGNTRIVCNPRGYPGENHDFDSGLVVEVAARS